MTTDPITLAVVRGRLALIAEQMQIAMIRSAFSMIVKESGDAAAAVFDRDGALVAQASGVPILLGAALSAVQTVLDRFGGDTMREGDVYALNDPYDGGSHLPDIATVAPVFLDGGRVGFCCLVAHHVDLGGSTVGSLPVNATEIFHEGLVLPPVKLVSGGAMDPGLRAVLLANTRFPAELIGDLEAQIAACQLGVAALQSLAATHGAAALAAYQAALIAGSAAMTRQALLAVPPGPFRFVQHMDDDGVRLGTRLRIEVAVRAEDGALTFDFTGTCPQAAGPFNATRSVVLAAAYYVVRCVTGTRIDTNAGCFAAIRLVLPPGSLVDPRPPAPVNARSTTFGFLVDVLFGALAQALPDRVPAASFEYPNISFGGTDPATGRGFVFNETGCGGLGARPWADGIDAFRSKAGNSLNAPIEATELDTPLRVERFALRPGSGGAGRFRGGLGYEKSFRLLRGEVSVSHRSERHTEGPYGLAGGSPGAPSVSTLERAGGELETIASKRVFRMHEGDVLHIATAGGGGHGDPAERDGAAIAPRHPRRQSPAMTGRDFQRPGRSEALGTYGVAATSHAQATLAALDMLRAGGNAVDAAVAAAAVLAVVDPTQTGIGGDCFILLARNGAEPVIALDGSGWAPEAASTARYLDQGFTSLPWNTPHAVTIPGAVSAWDRVVQDHGRLGLRACPPTRHCRGRGRLRRHRARRVRLAAQGGQARRQRAGRCDFPARRPCPGFGTRFRNPALAAALRRIAAAGSAAFYQGWIADDILRHAAGSRRPARRRRPGRVRRRVCHPDQRRLSRPHSLAMPARRRRRGRPADRPHLGAFRPGRLAAARRRMGAPGRRGRAPRLCGAARRPGRPAHRRGARRASALRCVRRRTRRAASTRIAGWTALELPDGLPQHRDTALVTVIDRDRNAVCLINSNFDDFGSGIVTQRSGIVLQNRGCGFLVRAGHPNTVEGRKRPLHTIIPALLTKDGRVLAAFGVTGGQFQPSGQAQVLSHWLDHGRSLQGGIDQPRIFSQPAEIELESGVPARLHAELDRLGYNPVPARDALGTGHAVSIDWSAGVLHGAADARRDGLALGC